MMGCFGTRAEAYVEAKQYRFDRAFTDKFLVPFDQGRLALEDGAVYDVTLAAKTHLEELPGCPRCGSSSVSEGAGPGHVHSSAQWHRW